ncbi:hypothetical protein ACLVWQ_20375 [Streptomyces sp. CWNU-52B]
MCFLLGSGWIDPLLFTCTAVLIGCLVALVVVARNRGRAGPESS